MTAHEYNLIVSRAAQNQPLRGTRRDGTGPGPHHWRVTAQRIGVKKQNEWGINPLDGYQYFSEESRINPLDGKAYMGNDKPKPKPGWRIYVGPGTVNDRVAAITYRREHDPRGWQMPENYPALDESPTVDRLLTERTDPPYLLLTGPGDTAAKTGGDFERIPDALRARHPSAFRTREMWELELWTAVVFVTAEPVSSSIAWDRIGAPLPTRNGRFRIAARSRMPNQPLGTQHGGAHQLATLYLTRTPEKPERDALYVQQRTYWSLWTANADLSPFGNFDPFLGVGPGFGGIGGGIVDAIGDATFATIDLITFGALSDISELYSDASTVQFWTA